MFHLRNLLGSLDSRSLITSALTLLAMGLLFGLVALGLWLFRPDVLRRIGLGGRQCASYTRRLLRKPCTVRLLGEPGLVPIQRQHLRRRQDLRPFGERRGRVSSLFVKNVLMDLHRSESRL